MSKTESLHYTLCCEGAKRLKKSKYSNWKYIAVELVTISAKNPDIWATNRYKSIMIKAIPNAFDDQVKRNGIEACNRPSVLDIYSGVKKFTTLKSFL